MLKKAVQRGRSERGGEGVPLWYVESLSDARTKLADLCSILLRSSQISLEERQSKDSHLAYELMISLQTLRLLHTTINAGTGERLTGDRWIQRAEESEIFDHGGVRWITWTGAGSRSGCSRAGRIESWELLQLHRAGDHLLDLCRLVQHYTSHPSAD